jgi:hypothetical protein
VAGALLVVAPPLDTPEGLTVSSLATSFCSTTPVLAFALK